MSIHTYQGITQRIEFAENSLSFSATVIDRSTSNPPVFFNNITEFLPFFPGRRGPKESLAWFLSNGYSVHLTRFNRLKFIPGLLGGAPPNNTKELLRALREIPRPSNYSELKKQAIRIIEACAQHPVKTKSHLNQITTLAQGRDKDISGKVLRILADELKNASLFEIDTLIALRDTLKGIPSEHLEPSKLIQILQLVSEKHENLHSQSSKPTELFNIVDVLADIIDIMSDANVDELSYDKTHDPLYRTLTELKHHENWQIATRAAYARESLIHIGHDKTKLSLFLRKALNFGLAVSGVRTAITELDLSALIEAYDHFKQALHKQKKQKSWYHEARILSLLIECNQFKAFETHVLGLTPSSKNYHLFGHILILLSDFISNSSERELRLKALILIEQLVSDSTWNPKKTAKNQKKAFAAIMRGLYAQLKKWADDPDIGKSAQTLLDKLHKYSQLKPVGIIDKEAKGKKPEEEGDSLFDEVTEASKINKALLGLIPGDTSDSFGKTDPAERASFSREITKYLDEQFSKFATALLCETQALSEEQREMVAKLRTLINLSLSSEFTGISSAKSKSISELFHQMPRRAVETYLPLSAGRNPSTSDSEDLEKSVMDFLNGKEPLLLLLGEGGSGKTTFLQYLLHRLWEEWNGQKPFPLLIPQEAFNIESTLETQGFSTEQITKMKKEKHFLFLFDGPKRINVEDWNAQVIIACRPNELSSEMVSTQKLWLHRFSRQQVEDYLESHLTSYKEKIMGIQDLTRLITIPFFLTALKAVLGTKTPVEKNALYTALMNRWFTKEERRLRLMHHIPKERNLKQELLTFCQFLAETIASEKKYVPKKEETLLLSGAPVFCKEGTYLFLHSSLLEHFLPAALKTIDDALLDEVEAQLAEKNYQEAWANLSLYFIRFSEETPRASKAFALLSQLIPHIDEVTELTEVAEQKLAFFPFLTQERLELAISMGDWHRSHGTTLSSLVKAMHFYGKAISLAEDHYPQKLKEMHRLASDLFVQAIRLVPSSSLEQIMEQIKILKTCCGDLEFMKSLYVQARDLYLKNPSQHKKWEEEITLGLTQKSPLIPSLLITEDYRPAIEKYRTTFKESLPSEIRTFQEKQFKAFQIFFYETFFQPALVILGPPPCNYDLRACGAIGRMEHGPLTPLKWFLLIEKKELSAYFENLVHLLELQIASLGERGFSFTPISGSEIISEPDTLLLEISLNKSRSLVCNTKTLFESLQTRKKVALTSEIEHPQSYQIIVRERRAIAQLKKNMSTFQQLKSSEKKHSFDLKKMLQDPLIVLLDDLSLYFGIEESNTFDIVDELLKIGFFTKESAQLIRHALNEIYRAILDFEIRYGKPSEEIILNVSSKAKRKFTTERHQTSSTLMTSYEIDSEELKRFTQLYWLVLHPLFHHLRLFFIRKQEVDQKSGASVDDPFMAKTLNQIIYFKNHYHSEKEMCSYILKELHQKFPEFIKPCENLKESLPDVLALETHLKRIGHVVPFFFTKENPVDLQSVALQEVMEKKNASLVRVFAGYLVASNASLEEHLRWYQSLSKGPATESLREVYLKTLERKQATEIAQELLLIPNRDGFRYATAYEERSLHEALICMTTEKPSTGSFQVKVIGNTFKRYLKPEIATQILDKKGHLQRQYSNSLHPVARAMLEEHDLHFKEKPVHPLMEYAIHSLTSRIAGHLTPAVDLVRFEVTFGGKTFFYPVLISKTVKGKNLAQALEDKTPLDPKSLTWSFLCAVLTRPGDGRVTNYQIDPSGRIFCVDNDISFVEPVVRYRLWRVVKLCSALFCIDANTLLDPEVLKEFVSLDPGLILTGWIDDVIAKEKESLSLFSPSERKCLYEEDKKNRFKATILFKSGTLTSLFMQFLRLQNFILGSQKKLVALDLLNEVITLDPNNESRENLVGSYIYRQYGLAFSEVSPKERLKKAIFRSDEKSLTSSQADYACLGKTPRIEELESKEEYGPERAKEELLAMELSRAGGIGKIERTEKGVSLQANFKQLWHEGKPDYDRQELVLEALTQLLEHQEKAQVVSITHCAVLTAAKLQPFLHEGVTFLDVRHCEGIKSDAVGLIEKSCPNLKELYISGCNNLIAFAHEALFRPTLPLSLPALEVLHIGDCEKLKTLYLRAPMLREIKANKNPRLRTPLLDEFKPTLTTMINFDKSPQVDPYIFINLCLKHFGTENISKADWSKEFCKSIAKLLYGKGGEIKDWEGQSRFIGAQLFRKAWSFLNDEDKKVVLNSSKKDELDCQGVRWLNEENLALLNFLLSNLEITSLNLSCNLLGKEGAKALVPVLDGLSSLKILNLSNNTFGKEAAVTIAPALARLSSLENLDLSCNSLGKEGAVAIAPALAKLSSLKTLNLSTNAFGKEGAVAIAPALAELSSLETLDLSHNWLGPEVVEALAPAFARLNSLKTLNLSENSLGNEGATAIIASALAELSSLVTLDLSHNWLGKKGALTIAHALARLSSLKILNLSNNSLGQEGAVAIAPALARLSSLEILNLSNNSLGNEGATAIIAPALAQLSSLKTLNLSCNSLGKEEVVAIVSALTELSSLETLDLSSNLLWKEEAVAITPGFARLSSLKTLNLNNNSLGKEGAVAIAPALAKLSSLETLDLSCNSLGKEGAVAISPALARLCFLKILNLSKNSLGKEGAIAIAPALAELSSLETLDLSSNLLWKEEAVAIAPALAGLSSLKTLNLRYNSLGKEGVKVFRDACSCSLILDF